MRGWLLDQLCDDNSLLSNTHISLEHEEMDEDIGEEVAVRQPPAIKKQNSEHRASANGKQRKPANLACLNCRPRKIKVGTVLQAVVLIQY